jgi:hypothetical protein
MDANKIIGDSFAEELHAAGVSEFNFSFHPDGTFYVDELTEQELADLQAVIDAHDAPTELDNYKIEAIRANQTEAGRRISALYGGKTGTKIQEAQRNDLVTAAILNRKESKGNAAAQEVTLLDALEAKALQISSIREAENDAAAFINDAANDTIAKIDLVKDPVWPA